MELIEAEFSERIIGCGIKVHRALGSGFLEKVYEEAMAIELTKAGLRFERQKTVDAAQAKVDGLFARWEQLEEKRKGGA